MVRRGVLNYVACSLKGEALSSYLFASNTSYHFDFRRPRPLLGVRNCRWNGQSVDSYLLLDCYLQSGCPGSLWHPVVAANPRLHHRLMVNKQRLDPSVGFNSSPRLLFSICVIHFEINKQRGKSCFYHVRV